LIYAFLADEKILLAIFIPITNKWPGIIICYYIYTIRFNPASIGQITIGEPLEKSEIAVSFTSNQIKIAIFVPIANCDGCSLTSAIAY
jgi:hypothetical protein